MASRSVDFPAPLLPAMATTVPGARLRERPSRIRVPRTVRVSPHASIPCPLVAIVREGLGAAPRSRRIEDPAPVGGGLLTKGRGVHSRPHLISTGRLGPVACSYS